MPFDELDGSLIATFGEDVEWTPNGSSESETVRVIRRDPQIVGEGGNALMTLFGTMADSGFSQQPRRGDSFEIGGETFNAFEVRGPDAIGGIYIDVGR